MKKKCPKCRGTGSVVVDYKDCDSCGGTGYQDSFDVGNHFKGVNSNAKAKFDLGQIRIFHVKFVMEKVRLKFLKNVLIVMAAVRLMYVMTAANQSVKNMIYVEIAIPKGRKIE